MTASMLAALETTVVTTAMPTVISHLGGLQIYSWVFSAYLLTSTVTVPIWGKLSDIYGRRRFYLAGIVVFLIGSVLSGVAHSMTALIIYRAIQGLGAGAVVPIGLTIIGDIFTLEERAKMQGFFSGVWGLASILGPVTGGFITDHLSWRWVFFINLPIGIVALAIIGSALIEPPHHGKRAPIDYAGAITLTGCVTLLLFLLLEGGKSTGWISAPVATMTILCIALFAIFIYIQTKASEPLLPLSLFQNRIFSSASVMNVMAGVVFYGAITYTPLFMQGVIGTTATQAGSVLTPLLLSWVTCSIITSRLSLKVGYRPMVIAGGLMLSIGSLLMLKVGVETHQGFVLFNTGLIGAGLGLCLTTMLLAVQNSVPRNQLGIATSSTMFFRTIAGALGVAIMGAILNMKMAEDLAWMAQAKGNGSSKLLALSQDINSVVDPIARSSIAADLLEQIRGALSHSLNGVFLIGLMVSVLAFITGMLVPSGKPHEHVHEPVEF